MTMIHLERDSIGFPNPWLLERAAFPNNAAVYGVYQVQDISLLMRCYLIVFCPTQLGP